MKCQTKNVLKCICFMQIRGFKPQGLFCMRIPKTSSPRVFIRYGPGLCQIQGFSHKFYFPICTMSFTLYLQIFVKIRWNLRVLNTFCTKCKSIIWYGHHRAIAPLFRFLIKLDVLIFFFQKFVFPHLAKSLCSYSDQFLKVLSKLIKVDSGFWNDKYVMSNPRIYVIQQVQAHQPACRIYGFLKQPIRLLFLNSERSIFIPILYM